MAAASGAPVATTTALTVELLDHPIRIDISTAAIGGDAKERQRVLVLSEDVKRTQTAG